MIIVGSNSNILAPILGEGYIFAVQVRIYAHKKLRNKSKLKNKITFTFTPKFIEIHKKRFH